MRAPRTRSAARSSSRAWGSGRTSRRRGSGSADEFGERLRHALELDVPSLIVLPIDYSLDVAISEELGAETVAT